MTKFFVCLGRDGSPSRPGVAARRPRLRRILSRTHVEDARREAAVLPAPEVLDKIMRYETKLERRIYRAMSQLERWQRMRRGAAVLAPMTIEVSQGA